MSKIKEYSFKSRSLGCIDKSFSYSDPLRPIPRSGHRIVTTDTHLYSFGGYNPNSGVFYSSDEHGNAAREPYTLLKEIWRCNIITKMWKEFDMGRNDFPNEVASNCIAKVGKNILIHGGTGHPFGHTISNDILVANLDTLTIRKIEVKENPPLAKYGQAGFFDHANMKWYFVGGTSGLQFFADVFCFDVVKKEWKKLGNDMDNRTPPGRYRHEIALYDDKLIVFGGGTVDEVFSFKELPVFNLKTNRWESLLTHGYPRKTGRTIYPRSRRCHSGVLVPSENGSDAKYIICGGMNSSIAFSDIWCLNLRTLQWFPWKTKLPLPMYFHDASLTPSGKMVVFGGILSFSNNVVLDTERTNMVIAAWVGVPKLSEIAWEAVLHYIPRLPKLSREEIVSLGIPKLFIDRIDDS